MIPPTKSDEHRPPIAKGNMWKFIKQLRAKYHSIFSLMAGSPKSDVWIDWFEERGKESERISISEFIESWGKASKLPRKYRFHFKTYYFQDEWASTIASEPLLDEGYGLVSATYRDELSVETISREFPHFLAYVCKKAILENKPLQLTAPIIQQYGFLGKYVAVLREQIQLYNERIYAELEHNHHL